MTRGEALRAGFHAALGVATLVLLLYLARTILGAVLEIISPFLIAMLLTLLLDPVVDRVQRRWTRGRRLPAVLTVFALFLLGVTALLTFLIPMLVGQARTFVERFPYYFDTLRFEADEWLRTHRRIGTLTLPPNFDTLASEQAERLSAELRQIVPRLPALIAGSVAGSIGRLFSLILVPIITLYLLVDIDRLRARLLFLLPDRYRAGAQRTALDVGGVFGNYVRGLITVCLAYAVAAVALLLLISLWFEGIRSYALLLGVAAGILYAVPYLGALMTLLLTLTVTLATGGGAVGALTVVLALVLLNQVFDNVVMPRVVGGGVGLHPVTSLFALLLGGNLFGLWGMLLSVPIAASIQSVLYRLFPRLAAPTPLVFLPAEGRAERRAAHRAAHEAEREQPSSEAAAPPPTGQ